MTNVKKVLIALSIIILIAASVAVTNYFTKRGTDKIISELNDRYTAVEESNRELKETNSNLINTNTELRSELNNSNRIIKSTKITITELETGITESTTIIDRIERTARAIGKIADQLPREIIILEESDSN